jgi:hypothetical protein
MLTFLVEWASDRKLRLFGCACCRQVWDLLTVACFRDAVEVAERFADRQAKAKELAVAKKASGAALAGAGVTGPRYCALASAWSCTRNPESAAMYPLWVFTDEPQKRWEIGLLRDIFGNPFRPITDDLPWLTTAVAQLAYAAYDGRHLPTGELDAARLAVLSDALEETGCTDATILDHLRGPGPHVRGCWAIDLLTGGS